MATASISTSGVASTMQADRQASAQELGSLSPAGLPFEFPQTPAAAQGPVPDTVDPALIAQKKKDAWLISAVNAGRADQVAESIDAGASLDAADKKGNSALLVAVVQDRPECVQVLLGGLTTAQINQAGPKGATALTLAAHLDRTEILKMLMNRLQTPEAINRARPDGYTALMLAAQANRTDSVQLLVGRLTRVEINRPGPGGYTALMWAAARDYTDAVKALADQLTAADINYQGSEGSALMMAEHFGCTQTTAVLRDRLKVLETISLAGTDAGQAALSVSAEPTPISSNAFVNTRNTQDAIKHAHQVLGKELTSAIEDGDTDRYEELAGLVR